MKGTYCLIMNISSNSKIKIGAKGEIEFNKGYYVYVGSAMNSLVPRIKRHLSKEKKLHWHVDYLLDRKENNVEEVIFNISTDRLECKIANYLSKTCQNNIKEFGCSDCGCESHLFYFKTKKEAIFNVKECYRQLNVEYKDLNYFNSMKN